MLAALGVDDAYKHRTQDFRRGHAQNLVQAGASVPELMAKGWWTTWRGSWAYQWLHEREHRMVHEYHNVEIMYHTVQVQTMRRMTLRR